MGERPVTGLKEIEDKVDEAIKKTAAVYEAFRGGVFQHIGDELALVRLRTKHRYQQAALSHQMILDAEFLLVWLEHAAKEMSEDDERWDRMTNEERVAAMGVGPKREIL